MALWAKIGGKKPASIFLLRTASSMAGAGISTMVTSRTGSRPLFFSMSRVVASAPVPMASTPIFLPLRSFTLLMGASARASQGKLKCSGCES
jgi:hypothetical protein